MRNFQYTFETHKQSFISAFTICMTVPLVAVLMHCLVILVICIFLFPKMFLILIDILKIGMFNFGPAFIKKKFVIQIRGQMRPDK